MLKYLLARNSIYIIAGDSNYDLSKMFENEVLDISTYHLQMVNKRTNIAKILINYVCIKKNLTEELSTDETVENIYVSDNEAIRIVIEKTAADFCTVS